MKKWILLLSLLFARPVLAESWSLDTVLRQVESNHPKLRTIGLIEQLAEAKVTEKEGAFDPSLLLSTEQYRYQSPTDPGKAKLADEQLAAVQIQDVSGWKLISGYRRNQGQVKSPDSLTGQSGEFFVEFKMPLLRGLGVNEKQTALEQARAARLQAQATGRLLRLQTMLGAALAYWDWSAACTEWVLLQRNLELASQRAIQVEQRVQAGDLPRVDRLEAQQELQRRQEALAKGERNVQKAALKLNLYLWNSQGQAQALPQAGLAPLLLPAEDAGQAKEPSRTTVAVASRADGAELSQAELQALQSRPELVEIQFQKEMVELDRRLAENDRLPALDLSVSPGLDTGPKSIGLTYKIGLQLTIPLATRSADGRLQAARLKSDKLDLDQVQEIQRILTEVRDAASMLNTSHGRLAPALESYKLARQLEEAERLKFSLGDSTLFLVNQRERATLAEAQKLIEILADSHRARATLSAAAGRL
ncbi:TolC family protein [bacterium]|nr:TolC family protein [bacterium]